jgi:hypothetical protein
MKKLLAKESDGTQPTLQDIGLATRHKATQESFEGGGGGMRRKIRDIFKKNKAKIQTSCKMAHTLSLFLLLPSNQTYTHIHPA